jgi:hypothetical protein
MVLVAWPVRTCSFLLSEQNINGLFLAIALQPDTWRHSSVTDSGSHIGSLMPMFSILPSFQYLMPSNTLKMKIHDQNCQIFLNTDSIFPNS